MTDLYVVASNFPAVKVQRSAGIAQTSSAVCVCQIRQCGAGRLPESGFVVPLFQGLRFIGLAYSVWAAARRRVFRFISPPRVEKFGNYSALGSGRTASLSFSLFNTAQLLILPGGVRLGGTPGIRGLVTAQYWSGIRLLGGSRTAKTGNFAFIIPPGI